MDRVVRIKRQLAKFKKLFHFASIQLEKGTIMQVVQSIHLPFAATSIAINEEKQCIAVSNAFAGELRVINFETQELIKTFEFEDNLYNGVNNILWKGSRIVAVTGAETEIRVWNDEGSETVISELLVMPTSPPPA